MWSARRAALTILLAVACGAYALGSSAPVAVQLLAINDLHGNLDPPEGANGRIGGVDAGGAEYLATHLATLKSQAPNTIVVSAGDNIGASPLLSGLFHDEPTIETLDALGLDVSAVGNHEFDEGWVELLRMQQGGCHPSDHCQDGTPFSGARFQYLAANVGFSAPRMDPALLAAAKVSRDDPRTTLLPPFVVRRIGGVSIAFLGMTLRGTASMVTPSGIHGLTFEDEAAAAARWVPEIERQGAHTIVLLVHQGGAQSPDTDVNGCSSVSGPIVDVVTRLPPQVAVVVTGHTHRAYNCTIAGRLVTSAASFGRVITAIQLTIDSDSGQLLSKTAKNVIVTRDVPKAAAVASILDHYRSFYETLAHRVIGRVAAAITRRANAAGESALGDVIADAQLDQARRATGERVAAAFMNSGGIRADLNADGANRGAVTYEDAYAVQPFGNRVIVKTLSGDALRRLLEQQFTDDGRLRNVLQVSEAVRYRYDLRRPPGQRVAADSFTIDGAVVRPNSTYLVAMNSFLADGGDGFSAFTDGTFAGDAGNDLDALEAYLTAHGELAVPRADRITRVE